MRTSDGDSICGGTIIDDETIISAAHCFDPLGAQADFKWISTSWS